MICRLTGVLESIVGNRAVVAVEGGSMAREVLVPSYLSERLAAREQSLGHAVTFHTLEYFEGQGQGTSFIPRILGFATPRERDLFELLTTVKGLGNKRALRTMAVDPGQMARAIASRDARVLQSLPEIGKKLAETIILELKDKVSALVADLGATGASDGSGDQGGEAGFTELKGDAVLAIGALVGLGETESSAERMVRRAMAGNPGLASLDEIIQAAYLVRS